MTIRSSRAPKRSESAKRLASPGRRAAAEILHRVEEESAFAAPLLASVADTLTSEDRALCYELVLGVLRNRLWLDTVIAHFAGRGVDTLDSPVRQSLRLGLYQLRFLSRIPQRAAVNESVNLVHSARLRSAAPFVNAVLRRSVRELDFDPCRAIVDTLERLSVETSHPVWLLRRWAETIGLEEARELARADNQPAPTSFRFNEAMVASDQIHQRLSAHGVEFVASSIVPGGYRLTTGSMGSVYLREMALEGLIYFQDEASQLVARVLGAAKGERILDVCSAPGGKTSQLAALAGDEARILAGDLYHHRLRLVGDTCARLSIRSVKLVQLNACETLPFADGTFDRVLLDAPCSGTGTLRHNPEIRWQLTEQDVAHLALKQKRMLRVAARAVRCGGRLVYSTCSLEREEDEEVVTDFLENVRGFRQVPVTAPKSLLAPSGAARTWPHVTDTDGFFVAAFEKLDVRC